MKVKELITKLLECPMDAEVVIQKELDYNIWVNSNVIISVVIAVSNTASIIFPVAFIFAFITLFL